MVQAVADYEAEINRRGIVINLCICVWLQILFKLVRQWSKCLNVRTKRFGDACCWGYLSVLQSALINVEIHYEHKLFILIFFTFF
jgi:hypothetical protein